MTDKELSLYEPNGNESVHIPLDCFKESERHYGTVKNSNRLSDLEIITGLNINTHRMTAVTACVDNYTNLISGIMTTYGTWDSTGDNLSDEIRLNIIGNMSGIYEFENDNDAGLSTDQQKASFEKLWWKEAEPDAEEFFKAKKARDSPDWDTNVTDAWKLADVDRNNLLELKEFTQFYDYVWQMEDRWTGSTQYDSNFVDEQMMAQFEACVSLSESKSPETCSLSDFTRVNEILSSWFAADKLGTTGYAKGFQNNNSTPNTRLSHYCETLDLDYQDYITLVNIESSEAGIEKIEFQTAKQPYARISATGGDGYAFDNKNWEPFLEGREMAGFYGYNDSNTGALRGLGFIEKDSTCFSGFQSVLAGSMSWISPKPGTEQVRPVYPEVYSARIEEAEAMKRSIKEGKLPEHGHDDEQEAGMIAVTVLVWVAVIILMGGLIAMMCKKRKGM